MKICFATHNTNKLQEVAHILGANFEIVGLADIGCTEGIPETGMTLEENSRIKADYVYNKYGINCFADDTGLEVASLGGEPGVYSARYAGEPSNSEANMQLLLSKLENEKERTAKFRTVITLIVEGKALQFIGEATGEIIKELTGAKGFGYDPIFLPTGYNQTFAEMSMDEKNSLSHRGKAVRKLVDFLKQ
ncbi:MAG: non-canonical purine NTP diphosphatase [Reichenbachiella sp.]